LDFRAASRDYNLKLLTNLMNPLIKQTHLAVTMLIVTGAGLCAQGFPAKFGVGYAGSRLALDRHRIEIQAVVQQAQAAQSGINAVTESLIEANAVNEMLAEKNRELKKQAELFGVARATGDRAVLEQRLLKSVRDLDLVHEDLETQRTQHQQLVSALNDYLGAPESMKRDHLPQLLRSLRESERVLAEDLAGEITANEREAIITDMRVIDVRDDLALVVVDAGKKHGVDVGMQMIIRNGVRPIAQVRAVDVRDAITGCVINGFVGEDNSPIEIGNQVRLDIR
jgi:hypothetical protein